MRGTVNNTTELYTTRSVYILLGIAVLANLSGLFTKVMDLDASRYASIAKTMVLHHNYLDLYCDGTDWLDKPHFPFWLTALSFEVFGFHSWAYKLPGVLMVFLGAFYTWLLAKELYYRSIAIVAVIILLTAQHIILSNNDVRAEPFLTGLIIAAVYHFYKSVTTKTILHIVIGSAFMAAAIMTKGIFAVVPVGSAIAGHLIITKNWKALFHTRWLGALVLIGIFILPELYALYNQFDRHPEKIVFGTTHVSGLRFFFWDSQFGRFINSGPIKGEGNPLFFFHTLLWAFLPWSFLLYIALCQTIRKNFRNPDQQEWYCICGGIATFVMFSASQFQLPHYLNIAFPFFAIITAQYLFSVTDLPALKKIDKLQWFIIILLLMAPLLIQIFFRPQFLPIVLPLMLPLAAIIIFSHRLLKGNMLRKIIYKTALAACFLNFYLNLVFYPSLLPYQSGSEAALWINANNAQQLPVASTHPIYSFEFYLNQPVRYVDISRPLSSDIIAFVAAHELPSLTANNKKVTVLQRFEDYPITRMDLQFFYWGSRKKTVGEMDVVLVQ